MDERKNAFIKLAEIRVNNAIKAMKLLGNLSIEHGPEFSKFVVNDEGKPITTLVVAVNGTQVDLGKEVSLKAGSEVILITPMSGG